MPVSDRRWRPYAGPLTRPRRRFLVLTRYGLTGVFASRLVVLFLMVAGLVPLGFAVTIYLRHNLTALDFLDLSLLDLVAIDARFFLAFLGIESILGFILVCFVAPSLVAPDLVNGALPLYLSRPFSRADYVLGKLAILALLLSGMTWVPGLLLFGLQASLEGGGWLIANARIAPAMIVAAWTWILLVGLLGLAISAWVRWRPVAGAMLFGIFFAGAGFGTAINGLLETNWGTLLVLDDLVEIVWSGLFGRSLASVEKTVPIWSAWTMLGAICVLSLWLLARRVRPCEVVR